MWHHSPGNGASPNQSASPWPGMGTVICMGGTGNTIKGVRYARAFVGYSPALCTGFRSQAVCAHHQRETGAVCVRQVNNGIPVWECSCEGSVEGVFGPWQGGGGPGSGVPPVGWFICVCEEKRAQPQNLSITNQKIQKTIKRNHNEASAQHNQPSSSQKGMWW